MGNKRVIVENVDEKFAKRFKELNDLMKNFKEGLDEARQEKELCRSKIVEIWYDLRKKYGLENVDKLEFFSEKKQVLSSQGRIFVERVDDEFIERFDEITKLRKKLDADVNFVMELNEVLEAKRYTLFTDVINFYHLEDKSKEGILQYDEQKNQIVLIDEKQFMEQATEDIKNFFKKLLDDLGR